MSKSKIPLPGIPFAGRLLLASALTLLLTGGIPALPLAAVGFAASGCGSPRPVTGSPGTPSTRMSSVTMGEVFEVQRGAAVLVDGHRLRFESVVAESRCPVDVNCVRAGEAVVALSFVSTRSIGEMRLQIPAYATAETEPTPEQSTTRGTYRFTLLALDPYPGTDAAEANERPVATLRVERLGN